MRDLQHAPRRTVVLRTTSGTPRLPSDAMASRGPPGKAPVLTDAFRSSLRQCHAQACVCAAWCALLCRC